MARSRLPVVLVGGLTRFVEALDMEGESHQLSWFVPAPTDTYGAFMALNPLASPTPVSDNPSVGALTEVLQKALRTLPGA